MNNSILKDIEATKKNINDMRSSETFFLYTPQNIGSTKSILENLTKITGNKAFITKLNIINTTNTLELSIRAQDIDSLYSYLQELVSKVKQSLFIKNIVISSNQPKFDNPKDSKKNEDAEVPFIINYLNKQMANNKNNKIKNNSKRSNVKVYNYKAKVTLGNFN
ncbi:MAG: hypothetical protein K9G11_02255 [Rickettsiaceae bacterium]|nr:hypothetical protein [Rickettsiaceae bacterium]